MSQLMASKSSDEVNEEERYASRTSFFGLDPEYYSGIFSSAATSSSLICWPPSEKYKILDDKNLFALCSSTDGVGIYLANIECRKALEASAFIEWLQSMGINSTIRPKSVDAQILVYIKSTICERPESFEIQIRQTKAILVAADFRGLLYGLTAFKELISHNGKVSFENDRKCLSLPCLLMSDAPSLARRGVTWSFQYNIFANKSAPSMSVRLLSNLKINTIFLVFDLYADLFANGSDIFGQVSHEFSQYQELVDLYNIRVIPMIFISETVDWEMNLNLIKRLFFQEVVLVFEVSGSTENNSNGKNYYDNIVEKIFDQLINCEVKKVFLSKSPQSESLFEGTNTVSIFLLLFFYFSIIIILIQLINFIIIFFTFSFPFTFNIFLKWFLNS
jgi:hypothetical protein